MAFHLPPLPYALSALEPMISERTLEFHYHKHHQGYVNNLNGLVAGTPLEKESLESVIRQARQDQSAIFNNAAQVWNHTFYWQSMCPEGGGEIKDGPLKTKIVESFGSVSAFYDHFKKAALTQFGSGWAWLVLSEKGTLDILKTGNADLPFGQGCVPLLTCDVWEHAYYLDYQNRRPDYVDVFLRSLAHWSFAEENLRRAGG